VSKATFSYNTRTSAGSQFSSTPYIQFLGPTNFLSEGRDISAGIMATLWGGPPRNRGSIAGPGRKLLSSPKRSDRLWCPNNTKFSGYRSHFNHSLPYSAENKWSFTSASLSLPLWEPRYSVWVTDWAIEESEFDYRQGQQIHPVFCEMFKPTLGSHPESTPMRSPGPHAEKSGCDMLLTIRLHLVRRLRM